MLDIRFEQARLGQIFALKYAELEYDYLTMEYKTGIGRAKLKRILNGTQELSLSDIMRMCDALNIKMKDLFK